MVGPTLAHYRILGKIGAGGMGEVYLAEDTKLDRNIALKILPQKLAECSERRARFEREARAVAALNHPNIVWSFCHSDDEPRDVLVHHHSGNLAQPGVDRLPRDGSGVGVRLLRKLTALELPPGSR